MAMTGLDAFDTTTQKTERWLNLIMERLGWTSRQRAYHAFRAVLHALRDRLTIEESAHFSAQLPLLVRGIYFDGWEPSKTPEKIRDKGVFLEHVRERMGLGAGEPENIERIVKEVFAVIQNEVTEGEISEVRSMFPEKLRGLWEG
ncbi:MAG: DUF2267 domain-containing protein [Chitinivibrionales bacterium]|nr:DUF2267 domain-containing protein [Chitinivibrionales bacterium]MBD3358659.1 DUF2267 domain-containing protein [Chitinivibrionales bacterium]